MVTKIPNAVIVLEAWQSVFGGCGESPDKMVRSVTGYKDLESTLKRLQLAGGNSRDLRIALLIGHKITNLQDHIAIVLPVSSQDDVSVANYTYQVASTLPGGIQILGLAVSLTPAQIKSQLPRLKGLVSSVWKSSCCGVKEWVELGGCGHQMIVYFSTDSRKIRCLSLDVTVPHSTFDLPGLEVKTISNPNLISVNSSLSFDINHITSQVNADISKTLRYTIKQCIDMISRGVATFKNRIPSDDDPVSTLLHKSDTSLIVDFFWRVTNVEETHPHEIKEGNQLRVKDGLYCRAYVHEKASWDDTVKALKLDGIKSLIIRQSTLLNELVDNSQPNKDSLNKITQQNVKLMLPRRVWCVAGAQGFSLTDYCFPNEGEVEVRENLRSIWGDTLDVVLEDDHEVVRTQEDEERSIKHNNKNHKIATGSNTTVYYLIGGVIVLIIAIILVIFTI